MGFTSMLLQITALRLLISTFSGNELDIGITLSFWLIYVGTGSFFGNRMNLKHAFTLSFVILAILSLPTVIAIKAIRPVLSLEPGETISLAYTILSTAVILFPLCFVTGLQFPLAVAYSGGSNAAGRVYGLEALGAFIGGMLFTFFISSRVGALELCLLLSLINIFLSAYVSRKKSIAFVFLIPLIFYLCFYKIAVTLPWHGMDVVQTTESRYGEIAVIKAGDQSSVFAGGNLVFTYPDPQTEEMAVHLPMTLHPAPQKILAIGGSPGILKEFLKYPVDHIDFIELDPKIIEVFLKLPALEEDRDAVRNRKVKIIIEDGRRFIKGLKKPLYNLIVLNLPQPSTAGINRFYTAEFFGEARKILRQDGLLAITISRSAGYIGRSMQTANGSIYNSLKSVFTHVELTAQEYGGIFASDSTIETDPLILEKRFGERAIAARHFNRYIFSDAFSSMNVGYVRERLSKINFLNRDLQPSAYLYNLMLWAEVHGGRIIHHLIGVKGLHVFLISCVLLSFTSIFVFRKKKPVIYFSVFSTGFSGMSFMLAGILAYQALHGYVYEMIGILSATFMIGLWAGTIMTKRVRTAVKILFYLEVTTIVLAIAAPLFFREEFLFYVLILLSGVLTGSLFSTASLPLRDTAAAGNLYGMDLIGSFLGAFIPSIILIPLFGVSQALLFVAFIKTFSAVMVLSILKTSGMTTF